MLFSKFWLLVILSFTVLFPINFSQAITIEVTTNIPGANCSASDSGEAGNPKTEKYTCTIDGGWSSVMGLIKRMLQFVYIITLLLCVLMIVFSGLQLTVSGIDQSAREEAKKRITQVIIGLIFLILSGWILSRLFPWIYL